MSSVDEVTCLNGLRVVQEMVYCSGWIGEFAQTMPSFADTLADVTCGLVNAFDGVPTRRVYAVSSGPSCSVCKGTGRFKGRPDRWLQCGMCNGRGRQRGGIQEVNVLGVPLLAPMLDVEGDAVNAPIGVPLIADACGSRSMHRAVSGFLAAAPLFAQHHWAGTAVDASDWFRLSCDHPDRCPHTVRCCWPFVWTECPCTDEDTVRAAKTLAADARLAMSDVAGIASGITGDSGWARRKVEMRFWDVEVGRQVGGARKKVQLSEAARWWLLTEKINRLRA